MKLFICYDYLPKGVLFPPPIYLHRIKVKCFHYYQIFSV